MPRRFSFRLVPALCLLALLAAACVPKDDGSGFHTSGIFAYMLGDQAEAKAYFERAVATNPDRGDSLIMLGDCYTAEGNPDKGIELIHQGMALTSNQGVLRLAQRKLARAYALKGDRDKALEHIGLYESMTREQGKLSLEKLEEINEFKASLGGE